MKVSEMNSRSMSRSHSSFASFSQAKKKGRSDPTVWYRIRSQATSFLPSPSSSFASSGTHKRLPFSHPFPPPGHRIDLPNASRPISIVMLMDNVKVAVVVTIAYGLGCLALIAGSVVGLDTSVRQRCPASCHQHWLDGLSLTHSIDRRSDLYLTPYFHG